MWKREYDGTYAEDEGTDAEPDGLVRPLAEVRDEDDDDHDGEVVAAGDEAAAHAGEAEASLERRDDDVHESVDCHALRDDEDGEEECVSLDVVAALLLK